MVMVRNLVKVGNREVKKRYIGNKLIFEDLGDKTEPLSGEEIFTDQADDSVVHVEIDGKSYQDGTPTPEYPIEIHSLNDFDVVSSVGRRNLIVRNTETPNTFINIPGAVVSAHNHDTSDYIKVEPSTDYMLTKNNSELALDFGFFRWAWYDVNMNYISRRADYSNEILWKTPNTVHYVRISYPTDSFPKLDKGNTATDWTPAPEDITEDTNHPLIDKINLSLNEPLRSVGNVKDRLFRDSDGLWKIERNVGEYIFDENTSISDRALVLGANSLTNWYQFSGVLGDNEVKEGIGVSSHFNKITSGYSDEVHVRVKSFAGQGFIPSLFILKGTFSSRTEVSAWLKSEKESGRPVTLLYVKNNSVIETLDQDLQDKLNNLRSFQDSNYVYTVVNDKTDNLSENLKPTSHTTFKSKGWYDYYKKTLLK